MPSIYGDRPAVELTTLKAFDMKPTKALILRIDTPLSHEYAKGAAESCDRVGLRWEYFDGFTNMSLYNSWSATGILAPNLQMFNDIRQVDNPMCCSAGHAAMWKKIGESDEATVVLEHDAVMLHNPAIDIPDFRITILGYKLKDITKYDHETAGPPVRVTDLDAHEGAHAYAITPMTARYMVNEIEERGILGCIDNAYFIRGQRYTRTPLSIMDPTPAIGWLRTSTLWDESAAVNYTFIDSFQKNYK